MHHLGYCLFIIILFNKSQESKQFFFYLRDRHLTTGQLVTVLGIKKENNLIALNDKLSSQLALSVQH